MQYSAWITGLASCFALACATGTYAPASGSHGDAGVARDDAGGSSSGANPIPSGGGGGGGSPSTSNEPPVGTCSHSLCATGDSLDEGCDTAGCDIVICDPGYLGDTYCCAKQWDSQCVQEVTDYCSPYSCN